jgi:hypothetical protein
MIVPSQFSHFWSNQKMKTLYLLTGTPPLPPPGAGPPGTVPLAAARACNNKQPNPSANTGMNLSDLSQEEEIPAIPSLLLWKDYQQPKVYLLGTKDR